MRKFVLLAPMAAHALTQSQCIELVKTEARKYTRYPTTIAAMAMQESSCGLHLVGDLRRGVPVTKASLGLMHFQLSTAREVIASKRDLKWINRDSDARLVTRLITDHRLSIRLACERFESHRKRYGWTEAVSRHNGGRHNTAYVSRIRKWMRWLSWRQ